MRNLIIVTFILFLIGGTFFLMTPDSKTSDNKIPFNTSQIKSEQLEKILPQSVLKNNGFETLLSNTPAKKAIDSLNSKESRELLQKSYETLSECYNIGCGQGPDRDGFYDPSLTVATITLKRILDVTASNFEKSAANLWITEEKLLEFLESENSELRSTSLANLFKLKGEEAFAIVIEKVRDLEGYAAGEIVEDLVSYLDEEKKQSFFDTIELLFKEKDSFTILETLERIETIKVSLSKLQQLSERLCRFVSIPTEGMNVKAMNHYLAKWAENNGISFNLNSHCL